MDLVERRNFKDLAKVAALMIGFEVLVSLCNVAS